MTPPYPLASFVLLAYKQEKYIREAVEGALSQTYSPLEIILSDDASPDRTFEIIQEMVATYQGPHRIIINRNDKNLGLGAHLKKCLQLASGDWFVAAAGDDISLPCRTQVIMDAVRNNPGLGGIWSGFEPIDEQGMVLNQQCAPSGELLVNEANINHYLNGYPRRLPGHANGCAAAWHRDVFAILDHIPDNCWCEDMFFSIRCLTLGLGLQRIAPCLVRYRSHETNLSGFRRDNESHGPQVVELIRKAAATCDLIHADLLKMLDLGMCGINSKIARQLLETVRMTSLRLSLDSDIVGNNKLTFTRIWRVRVYYTHRVFASIVKKWLLQKIS